MTGHLRHTTAPTARPSAARVIALAAGLACAQAVCAQTVTGQAQAGAQDAAARPGDTATGRAWTVVPSASLTQTFTDNALLRDADKRNDSVTQGTLGISIGHRSASMQGLFDYQLTGSAYARESKTNNTLNALRASLHAELVDEWLFLDGAASISQQDISAFGVQTSDPAFDSPNRTEVRNLSLTPTLRHRLGSWGLFEASHSYARNSAASTNLGDSTGEQTTVALSSNGATRLGWSASASRQRTDFKAGRSATTDGVRGGLNYRLNSDLRLSGSLGRESSTVISSAGADNNTWGVGLEWLPSERTQLVLQRDHRYFGDAHVVRLQHRMARSLWYFTSTRDLSTGAPSFVTTAVTTMFDLLYAQAAAEQPEPVARRQLVLQRLAAQGINPGTSVSLGFLSSAVTLLSRQELGFSLQGVRSSMALAVFRSDSRRVDENPSAPDDLAAASRVRQTGLTLTAGHRLTPESGLSLAFSRLHTTGSTSLQDSALKSLTLGWTSRLSAASSFSLGARHVVFDSRTSPYTESAGFATWAVRF